MKLPLISSEEMIKFLSKKGFEITRQKGSHVSMHKSCDGKTLLVVVPRHREIKIGTLISILRQANLTRDEFLKEIR